MFTVRRDLSLGFGMIINLEVKFFAFIQNRTIVP